MYNNCAFLRGEYTGEKQKNTSLPVKHKNKRQTMVNNQIVRAENLMNSILLLNNTLKWENALLPCTVDEYSRFDLNQFTESFFKTQDQLSSQLGLISKFQISLIEDACDENIDKNVC